MNSSLILRWVQQKQLTHSRAIEHDADRRVAELSQAGGALLLKGLTRLNEFESAQEDRRDAGSAALKESVATDDECPVHVLQSLQTFVVNMEANTHALAVQQKSSHQSMDERIKELK